jgi:hypothetical protein
MTYTVDLTTVLKWLFDIVLSRLHRSSGTISWLELKEAFEAYERSGSRRQIHDRIREIFQQGQQIPDLDNFQRIFLELVEDEGTRWVQQGRKGRSQSAKAPAAQSSALQTPAPPPTPSRFSCPRRMRIPCLCP